MDGQLLKAQVKMLIEDYDGYNQGENVGEGVTSLMRQFQSSMSLYEQVMKFIDKHPDDEELQGLKGMIEGEVRTSDDLFDLIQVAEFLNDMDTDCRCIKKTMEDI
jgi:hypothetical protein